MSFALLSSIKNWTSSMLGSGYAALCYIGKLPFRKRNKDEVVLHSYSQFLFIWPVILIGILFWIFRDSVSGSERAGWAFITVLFTSVLTMGIDLNRNSSIFWLLVVALIWVLSLWLEDVQGLPIMRNIIGYFRNLNVAYDPASGYAFSLLLTIVLVLVYGKAVLNDRWRISHNLIEHVVVGQSDRETARGAKGFSFEFTDVLEVLIAGSGTMKVLSAQGSVMRVIPHVPLLLFKKSKIQKLFESVEITTDDELVEGQGDMTGGCDDTHEPPLH